MKLPDLRNFDLNGKRVLVRVDFDVPLIRREGKKAGEQEEWVVGDQTRIENSLLTIKYLLSVGAKITLLSHLGRPEGKIVQELSLIPVAKKLQELLPEANLQFKIFNFQSNLNNKFEISEKQIILLENLRFDPGEESNDPEFARKLASLSDFYVNEAFAVSHREHASIVSLPKLLRHAAGLSLLREVEVLSGILTSPKRPLVVILGGAKEDKLAVMTGLLKFADQILIGGKLPALIPNSQKVIIADLNPEGKDITLETIEKFSRIIQTAGTIIWNGPMGEWEVGNGKWEVGTKKIGEAVVKSGAFTIIGGGDTEAALTKFGLVQKINFVSSGGGAMLEFLAKGDLPGLAVLRN